MRADEQLLHQLLADRAAALLDAVAGVVGQGGPQDGAGVNPGIRVEGVVFDRDRRVDQIGRDVTQRHHDPMIALVADVGQQGAVTVEDQHVLRQPARSPAGHRRQVADRLRRDGRDGQQRHGQQHDERNDQVPPEGEPAPPVPLVQVVLRMAVAMLLAVAAPHAFTSRP